MLNKKKKHREQVTIAHFLNENCEKSQILNLELKHLIESVANSIKKISDMVNQGDLINVLGEVNSHNFQGEKQKKLDILSNEILIKTHEHCDCLVAIASEEMENFYLTNKNYNNSLGKYLLLVDPLDGSSNIDVNSSIGTIFSILSVPANKHLEEKPISEEDFLQIGRKQLVSGYAIYGPQTQLVFTFGDGVAIFTLDRGTGLWILTEKNVVMPQNTAEFSINMSNMRHWDKNILAYINNCLAGESGIFRRNYNMRWIGSMVADIHRILMHGGIFLYPTDKRKSYRNGKLRLMYEANPISFLVEQSGGKAIDGNRNILDIKPNSLHQRIGLIIGAREDIGYILDLFRS